MQIQIQNLIRWLSSFGCYTFESREAGCMLLSEKLVVWFVFCDESIVPIQSNWLSQPPVHNIQEKSSTMSSAKSKRKTTKTSKPSTAVAATHSDNLDTLTHDELHQLQLKLDAQLQESKRLRNYYQLESSQLTNLNAILSLSISAEVKSKIPLRLSFKFSAKFCWFVSYS